MDFPFRIPSGGLPQRTVVSGMDNMTTVRPQQGIFSQMNLPIQKTAVPIDFGNLYSMARRPPAKSATTEATSNTGTTYSVKIAPTNDGSHMKLMSGDICFSYGTDEDQRFQNDVYTIYSIPQFNKRAIQHAAKVEAMKRTEVPTKRNKTEYGNNYSNSSVGPDRYLKLFSLCANEFMQHWKWAGIMSWTAPNLVPDPLYKEGYNTDINQANMFRFCSMVIWSVTNIAHLISEEITPITRLSIIGSNVMQTFEGAYDARGRKIASMVSAPGFQLRIVSSKKTNDHPSYLLYSKEYEAEKEIIFPLEDPVTLRKFDFSVPPPVSMRITEVEAPYIQPLGIVTESHGPIPTESEVKRALIDSDQYTEIMKDSTIKLHLFCEGWGPYNNFM